MRRLFFGLAFASLVGVAGMASADDQAIANHIVGKLRDAQDQGQLKDFDLNMEVTDGVVWFKGQVDSAAQETLVLKTAQRAKNLGVVKIVDEIEVRSAVAQSVAQEPVGQSSRGRQQVRPASNESQVPPQGISPIGRQTTTQQANYQVPLASGNSGMVASHGRQIQGEMIAPAQGMPMGAAAPGGTYDQAQMPNYSWPSYAAHPNYAAVNYPRQYSPTAWPYIGPFYPYPQVPMGWRKVTLEWDDGWWYLDFNDR
jgi:BON domain